MKVKELKEKLADLPDDMEVILQRDPEGNGFGPLYCCDSQSIHDPKTGDTYSTKWSAYDACMEEKEWEEFLKRPRCLVLSP